MKYMETKNTKGKRGLSFSIFASVIFVFSLALAFFQLRSAADALDQVAAARYLSYKLADELRQSSDDLTRLGRTYVVTGDASYEHQYNDILDIRNGKKPRPVDYWRIYWDFVATGTGKPRPDERAVPLLDLMKAAGFTDAEFGKLQEAQAMSDSLVNLEVEAMNAVKGLYKDDSGRYARRGEPNMEHARRLLHSREYHAAKARIMKPVDEFFVQLEARTARLQAESKASLVNMQLLFLFLLVGTLCSFAATVWFGYKRLLNVLGGRPFVLDALVRELAAGNLAVSLPTAHQDSAIGQISAMTNKLRNLIAGVRDAVEMVDDSVRSLKDNTEQSARVASETNDSTAAMASAIEGMSVSISHIAEMAQEGRSVATNSEMQSEEGRQIIVKTADEIRTISDVVAQVSARISELGVSSEQISGVVQVIRDVADQTNLLALNAAIEAARAGESGRGFAVVADEVRKLAERTSAATGEIAGMINSIQQNARSTEDAMREVVISVQAGVEHSDHAAEAVVVIREAARRSLDVVSEINHALGEQGGASQVLAGQVERVRNNSEMTSQSSVLVADSVRKLASLASELRAISERFKI